MILNEYTPKGIRVVGDTWKFETIVPESPGNPLDLTDATVTLTLGASVLTATGTKADQTAEMGRVTFTFTPAETATVPSSAIRAGGLRWRIRVSFSSSLEDTVGSGWIKICAAS